MALTNKLINIANTIREKTGKSDPLTLDSMVEAIESISAGGGDTQSVLDSLIEGSITEVTSNVTSIGNHVFYHHDKLTSINFPEATAVGNYAFHSCEELTSMNIPKVTVIGKEAFGSCKKLTSVDFPLVTDIVDAAFYMCSGITSVDCPLATKAGANAFGNCYALTSINLPSLTTFTGSGVFGNCRILERIKLPILTALTVSAFYGCYELKIVDLPLVTAIDTQAFCNDSELVAVILRAETVCALSNANAFLNCYHFYGTNGRPQDGYIYVPAALIEDYKAATNWSTLATQFRALEDYTVDGTTTGALDESKI